MPTPITTDLAVLNQGINIDIESIAPVRNFAADSYDVANMTITATVNSPSEQRYRLVLAADVEAGTSAFARVVSATKDHFKDIANFKRIVYREAGIIKPVLAKAGISEPPWVAWRLLTLETRMGPWESKGRLGGRLRVGTRLRRRPGLSA